MNLLCALGFAAVRAGTLKGKLERGVDSGVTLTVDHHRARSQRSDVRR